MPTVADFDRLLHREIGAFRYDPLGFVLFAFPWGLPHTPLAGETGPEPWQREVLEQIGKGLLERHFGEAQNDAVRVAIASGHGIGKSALGSWIILWALSTLHDSRGVVSANTEGQLRTKTWPELAKGHAMSRNKEWFTYTATALHSAEPGRDKRWRVDAITWSEQNTEAIAGLHNKGRRAFVLLDEASAVPDPVWDTIEGALTDSDTELIWSAFGNPTRTTGRFRECFAGGRFAHRWNPRQIDSRSVGMTNKVQIAAWVKDHGEDSDFVRVRVRGAFPRAGSLQFIDSQRIAEAVARPLEKDPTAPLVMGVDIARHGEDQSVIRFRRGLDARSIPAVKFRIPDADGVAVAELGEPVADAPAHAGGVDEHRVGIVRIDLLMKDWCRVGCLPDDADLVADLGNVEYGYDAADALLLERKDDMRRRGLASPDDGDALALTFAYPVAKKDWAEERRFEEGLKKLRRWVV